MVAEERRMLAHSLVVLRLQEVELLLDPLDGLDDVELEGGRRTAPGLPVRPRGAPARHLKRRKTSSSFVISWRHTSRRVRHARVSRRSGAFRKRLDVVVVGVN